MWTLAGTLRLTVARARLPWLTVPFLVVLLTACGSGSELRPVLAEHCTRVGGHHDSEFAVTSPADGTLRLSVEERGISVMTTLDGDPRSAAESPVERLGSIQLVSDTRRGQRHTIRIRAEDSPDITAEYCARADLIAFGDSERRSAETAFAAAGQATHTHDWNTAFEKYLEAARLFDHLALPQSAGEARYALAEIAYLRLDRKRESYALAAEALANYDGDAKQFKLGGLAALQGKALLDMPGLDSRQVAPRVSQLQAAARNAFRADPAGARELPRVDIMAGFLEYRLDAFTRALALFSDAGRTCRAIGDWDCYAIASQNVALLQLEGKNYTVALSTLSEALDSLPRGLDPKLAGDMWNNYGIIQGKTGLFSDSERSLSTAMRQYAQVRDCQGVRRNLARSGKLLAQLGSLSDAMHSLQQSASLDCAQLLAAATNPLPAQPAPSTSPAADQLRQGPGTRGPLAVAWCDGSLEPQGLAIENKLIVFNSLVSLGDTLMLQGESAPAQRCLDAAEPYASTAQARMRLADARGEALLERQDAKAAQAVFQQSIRIANEAEISPAYELYGLAKLGIVRAALLAGNAAQAVPDGLAALEASINRGDIDQTVASLRLLAAGYRELNQPDRAARTLQTAVSLIEAVPIDELDGEKRATYLATQFAVFAELTDLYASAADANPSMASLAFTTSERGRSRSLRYAVTQAERNVSSTGPLPAARYQKLLQDVVSLTGSRSRSGQSNLIDRLDEVAVREQNSEAPFDQQQLTPTLSQLHATLIEYAVGTHDMFAFVVNEGGLHVIRLGDRRKIASAAAELHDRLLDAEAPQSEVQETARHLAELVLWPISAQLSGQRLIIVPDDGLHTIPFNVLPWSAAASDHLVLQHAEVSIVPSALFLTRIRANGSQHSNSPRIELLGDPVFRLSDWHRECTDAIPDQTTARTVRAVSDWTESLPRLPGSRAEVQMVARLSQQSRPASRIEVFLGCAAVPAALRQAATGHVDLLHIATHARVDSQRPRLSALALTPEHRGAGTASAFGLLDILGLKFSSNLVVLSACETSRGRLLPGEGVLGPAQAFLQAGAGAVLASYWRVDDLATSKFMQGFYRYLLAERLPAATALRRAQIEAAEASPSHDWAAFSLYGWPDSSI
jgi:CHAT domain-containing protein/tetratricopeptide (TPR) repeat protein